MFDLITVAMMFLYIALSLSVVGCSCVRTSRVLFVLQMYEELQPGQVNSVNSSVNVLFCISMCMF